MQTSITLSNEYKNYPRSFFIITLVYRVGAVPKQSTLDVQTVGISNTARIENNLADVYIPVIKSKICFDTIEFSQKVYY